MFEKLLVKFMVVSCQPLGYTQVFLLVLSLLVVHEAQKSRVLEALDTKNKHIWIHIKMFIFVLMFVHSYISQMTYHFELCS